LRSSSLTAAFAFFIIKFGAVDIVGFILVRAADEALFFALPRDFRIMKVEVTGAVRRLTVNKGRLSMAQGSEYDAFLFGNDVWVAYNTLSAVLSFFSAVGSSEMVNCHGGLFPDLIFLCFCMQPLAGHPGMPSVFEVHGFPCVQSLADFLDVVLLAFGAFLLFWRLHRLPEMSG